MAALAVLLHKGCEILENLTSSRMFMQFAQQRRFITMFFLFTLLAGCSSHRATPTTTSTLQPLLVQPEDIGWPTDSYFEREGYVPGEIAVEDMMAAGIGPDPLPRRSSNISPFRSAQNVWIYADKDAATQTFNVMVEQYEFGFLSKGSSLDLPELTNSWWFCNEGLYDSQLGNYMMCFSLAQRAHILELVIMPINGKVITFEDWQLFVDQMHQRLIDYPLDSESQN